MHPLNKSFLVVLVCGLALALPAAARQGCPTPARSGSQLFVESRPENALIVDATVKLEAPAPIYVEYGNDHVGWLRIERSEPAATHRVPIVRLRVDSSYQLRAYTKDGQGCPSALAVAEFRTGVLPEPLNLLSTEVTGRPSFPLVLMDLRRPPLQTPGSVLKLRWLLALDGDGQIVWYYPIPFEVLEDNPAAGANAHTPLSNGNFLYLAMGFGVEEITPDAQIARRALVDQPEIHHDVLALPDGRALFIGADIRNVDTTPSGGAVNSRVRGDGLYSLDLDSGQYGPVWSTFDDLDPNQRPERWRDRRYENAEDWTHANSISLGPRGNVLVSFRHLDQVVSLSSDLKSVEWKLGGPGSSFTFPDESDRFYAQHSVSEGVDGRVLIFDNGALRPEGEFSRAL